MVGYHRETHHFREEKSTKELTVPQHTRFILPLTSPDKIHRCAAWAVFFFYGHLSGRRPLHLANARPFGRSKAPLRLFVATQTRACLWQAEQAHHANNEKQEVPDGELPVLLIMCGFLQGASYSGVPPVFVLSSLFRPMAPSRIPQKNAGRFF